jgi:PhnB protein
MEYFKPEGYNSVCPYFIVRDTEKWIELLKEVFDAKLLIRYENNEGVLLHGELALGDSIIMLSGGSKDYPPHQLMVHVYVPDTIQTFKKAVQAGCQPLQKPSQSKDDPDMRALVKDFAGNTWIIATRNIDLKSKT